MTTLKIRLIDIFKKLKIHSNNNSNYFTTNKETKKIFNELLKECENENDSYAIFLITKLDNNTKVCINRLKKEPNHKNCRICQNILKKKGNFRYWNSINTRYNRDFHGYDFFTPNLNRKIDVEKILTRDCYVYDRKSYEDKFLGFSHKNNNYNYNYNHNNYIKNNKYNNNYVRNNKYNMLICKNGKSCPYYAKKTCFFSHYEES